MRKEILSSVRLVNVNLILLYSNFVLPCLCTDWCLIKGLIKGLHWKQQEQDVTSLFV